MPRKSLRVVSPNETPTRPVRKKSVAQAAELGDHRGLLVAMRERIAKAVSAPECPPRDLASLTRRLQDISKEITAIDHAEKAEAERGGQTEDEAFDASAI